MQIQFVYIIISLCLMVSIAGRTVFDQLFQSEPRAGYYYPTPPRSYQPQKPRARSQEHQRSYKDICRTVNTNGFTNPGNIPRCPY